MRTKRVYKTCLMLIILTIGINYTSYSQVGITGVPFLEINNDARSMGMAGANMAQKGIKNGIHLNPASMGMKNQIEISSPIDISGSKIFFSTEWLPDFNTDIRLYTPQVIVGLDKFTIGYQHTYIDLGQQFSNLGEPINFKSYEFAHTLAVSYPLNEYFSIGAGLSYFKSSLATGMVINADTIRDAKGLTLDLGFLGHYRYETYWLITRPSFGLSLTDIGQPIAYTKNASEESKDPLPTLMRAGLGLEIDLNRELAGLTILSFNIFGSLEKIMARRESDREPYGPLKAIFSSWGPYERPDNEVVISLWDQMRRQIGGELVLFEILSFRRGLYYEHPQNGDRQYTTTGIGIKYKSFSFDYTKLDTKERNHSMTGTEFYQFTVHLPL